MYNQEIEDMCNRIFRNQRIITKILEKSSKGSIEDNGKKRIEKQEIDIDRASQEIAIALDSLYKD